MSNVVDSFNRADSTTTMGNAETGQTWVPVGGATWGILGNLAYVAIDAAQATTTVDSGMADCTIQATLSTVADAGLCWRSTDTNNHFILSANGSAVYRKQAGGFTQLATGAAWSNGDTVTVILAGSSHIVQKNGVTVFSFTDAFNQTATKHGLRCNSNTTARFNDFSITGAASQIPRPFVIAQAVRRAATR